MRKPYYDVYICVCVCYKRGSSFCVWCGSSNWWRYMRDALDANITKIELFILSYDTKWRRKQVKLDHTHICAYIYDVYYIYNDICIKYSMVLQEKKIQKDVTIWNSLVPKTKKNKQEKQKKKIFYVLQLTNVGVCGSGRGRILVVFFLWGKGERKET